jgi:hypothetical protein
VSQQDMESIQDLIERSSLGTRSVRLLAQHTPAELVDMIVRQIPPISPDVSRDLKTTRTYSSAEESNDDLLTRGGTMPNQKGSGRQTGKPAAKAASKVLRDGRSGKTSKTAAGSALSQRAPQRKGK